MGSQDIKSNRIEWIDLLRGIAMLLVIWGHVDRTDRLFFIITGSFKMPLFFAITGYLFKDRNGDIKQFLSKLLKTIIVPWVILSLIWLKPFYALLRGKIGNIPIYLYNFISGKDLWFMPCIVLAEVIFFLILKLIKDDRLRYLAMCSIAVFGIVLSEFGIGRFAMFDVACTAQAFLMFGYWFKNNEESLRTIISFRRSLILVLIYAGMILLSLALFPGSSIDVHKNRYYNYPLCAAMSFVSLLLLFIIAPKINLKLNWIRFVGRNTLVFYIVHYHARSLLLHGANLVGFSIPKTFLSYVLVFAYICVSMSIVSIVINRWFPFILGRSKTKSS